jgi:hypothetical protein
MDRRHYGYTSISYYVMDTTGNIHTGHESKEKAEAHASQFDELSAYESVTVVRRLGV